MERTALLIDPATQTITQMRINIDTGYARALFGESTHRTRAMHCAEFLLNSPTANIDTLPNGDTIHSDILGNALLGAIVEGRIYTPGPSVILAGTYTSQTPASVERLPEVEWLTTRQANADAIRNLYF